VISSADLVRLTRALRDHQPPSPRLDAAPPLGDELVRSLAQAVHFSRSSVVLTDADLDAPGPRVVYANPAFEALTGYRADELVGTSLRALQGPATDRAVLDRLRDDLEAGRPFEGRAINYRKDGTPFVMSWRIAAVAGPDGAPTGYVAIQDDATRAWLAQLHQHETIDALQSALLPAAAPVVAGLEVAATYRPADDRSRLGGDWYDGVDAPDGTAHLLVGDVTGHGTVAAAHMGQFRWALNALLASGQAPVDAVGHVRRLARGTEMFATVAIVSIPPGRDRVDVVTAGHPPVILLGTDGSTTALSTDLALLGPATPHADVVPASAPLRPGDVVCAYSDGLVERRDRSTIDGVALLRRHLSAAPPTPAEPLDGYVDSLVRALVDDQAEDDTAAVLARRA